MLNKNKTPTKEPKISIGIVLPEDRQLNLDIKINGTNFEVYIDQKKVNDQQHVLSIKQTQKGILVNGTNCKKLHIKNISRDISNNIHLEPIVAGRGFHWQKSISIQVLGDLQISSLQSSLFVVNTIFLEDYLMCVATSEMSGNCPKSLLESQTIAARSWVLAGTEEKHKDLYIDACNDDCCQRYQGIENLNPKSISATNSTRGMVLVHDGIICDTRYSKSCGGITEKNDNVWSSEPKEYLSSVYDGEASNTYDLSDNDLFHHWLHKETSAYCGPKFISETKLEKFLGNVDKKGKYYRWQVIYNNSQLTNIISKKTNQKFKLIKNLIPQKRGLSGRIILLEIQGVLDDDTNHSLFIESEYEIRRTLHHEFLYSSAFTVESNSNYDDKEISFTLKGAGWGHGVGLCQIGALGMALDGKKMHEILSHYYQSSEMRNIYE